MKHLPFALIILLLTVACSRQRQDWRMAMARAEALVETDADSAYRLVCCYGMSASASATDSALYDLLLVQAAWKSYRPIPSDGSLRQAIRQFALVADSLHLARAYYYQGVLDGESNDRNQQVDNYQKAAEILDEIGDFRYQGIVNDNLAYCYRQQGRYEMAKSFDEIAVLAAWNDHDTAAVVAYTMNSLSYELQTGRLDEADSVCRQLLLLRKATHLVYQRMAQVFFKKGDFIGGFRSAVNYLSTAPTATDSMYAYQLLRYYYASVEDEYENYVKADKMVRRMAERDAQLRPAESVAPQPTRTLFLPWLFLFVSVLLLVLLWHVRRLLRRRERQPREDVPKAAPPTEQQRVLEAVVTKFVMPSANQHTVSGELYWKSIVDTFCAQSRANRSFVETLNERCPSLSNRERAMCVLYESEQPTDRALLDLFEFPSAQAFRTAKSRLRKKLQQAAAGNEMLTELLRKVS